MINTYLRKDGDSYGTIIEVEPNVHFSVKAIKTLFIPVSREISEYIKTLSR